MPRRLTLKYPSIVEMTGCNELVLVLDCALVRPKAKRNDSAEVRIEFGRSSIACILKELRKLHDRDLARLVEERARITREARALARDET